MFLLHKLKHYGSSPWYISEYMRNTLIVFSVRREITSFCSLFLEKFYSFLNSLIFHHFSIKKLASRGQKQNVALRRLQTILQKVWRATACWPQSNSASFFVHPCQRVWHVWFSIYASVGRLKLVIGSCVSQWCQNTTYRREKRCGRQAKASYANGWHGKITCHAKAYSNVANFR